MKRWTQRVAWAWCHRMLPLLVVAMCAGGVARAQSVVQEFFIPLPEEQIRSTFLKLYTSTGTTFDSVVSIVVNAAGSRIVYDHWEDGYEIDLNAPLQSTTKVWGDGNNANGIAPGFASDPASLTPGTVLALRNNVTLPRNPATVVYDGRDRVGTTKAIVISRAAWATNPGSVLSGAVEVSSTLDYGTSFICPVGENVSAASMFEVVDLYVQAGENGTGVSIDKDANGSYETVFSLNRGESYRVNGGVFKGARVTATKPVQVHVITGDINANYECDWFTLYPVDQWTGVYYSPVGTANDGDHAFAFLYNPGPGSIVIDVQTRVGTTNFTVAANGTQQYQIPKNSGARFASAGGEPFFALETVGANPTANNVHDWGFTLVPEGNLTTVGLVGWGPGSSDLSQNGSPVWVTAVADTTLYVDYDGDRAGALTDPNGDPYDVSYALAELQSLTLYDPDKDQTAMRFYTLDGTLITAAWGQDPFTAGPGNPFLDLGTTVLPFPVPVIRKSSVLTNDVAPAGLSIGDTLLYTVTIDNRSLQVLGNVIVVDAPPPSLQYVTNSTYRDGIFVPDNTPTNTAYPLDENGYTIPVLPRGTAVNLSYRAVILSSGSIANGASGYGSTVTNIVEVPPPAGADPCALAFTDAGGGDATAYAIGGDVYVTLDDRDANQNTNAIETVDVVVENTSNGDLEIVTLTELAANTNLFRNTVALPTSDSAGLAQLDGTLLVGAGNSLAVDYLDPLFNDSCADTALIATPSAFKTLYLSTDGSGSPDQDLDRIDPVATADATTATTAVMTASSSIAFDAATSSTTREPYAVRLETRASTSASNTTFTLSHTTSNSLSRLLLVGLSLDGGTGRVSSVTYAGQALTPVGSRTNGANEQVEIWRLLNPPAGTANVAVNLTGARAAVIGAATFSGVDANVPLGAFASAVGSSTTPSVAVTSAAGQLVFDTVANGAGGTAVTPGGGQTELWDVAQSTVVRGAASTEAGAASVTMSWTSGNAPWAIGGVSIRPATNLLTLTHATGYAANRHMLVGFAFEDDTGATDFWITNVQYIVGSTTQALARVIQRRATTEAASEIWSLTAPNSGTGVVRVAINAGSDAVDALVMGVATFSGVNQSTPLGTANSAIGTTTPATVNVTSAAGELVFDTLGLDDARAASAGGGQTARWNLSSETAGDGITGGASTEAGAATTTMSWTITDDDWALCAVPLKPAPAALTDVTFTQTPALCDPLALPAGGTITITNYITVTSGTMPNPASVTARLKHGTSTIATDATAAYSTAGGVTTLTWSATLAGATNIPAGAAIFLNVSNAQSDVAFRIDYDSQTKPSKVILPTTSLIDIETLGVYDAAYPGGSLVTTPNNGATLYVRALVSDPFGAYDITDVDLTIDGPGSGDDLTATLTDANVVTNDGCSKVYEYVWVTGSTEGAYTITTVANEGTEGITDTAATSVNMSALDLGTPCGISFTAGDDGAVTNTYGTNSSICVRVTDLDENTSAAAVESVPVLLTTSGGDSEVLVLTETGTNTGVFADCIAASIAVGSSTNDGVLYAPAGTVVTVSYVDPDDATDPCSTTAAVPPPGATPAVAITKTLLAPADGQALIGEAVQFRLRVVNTGSTTLNPVQVTDAFATNILSYVSASPAPDTVSGGTLTWNNLGSLSPGGNADVLVNFTALALAAPTTNRATVVANGSLTNSSSATLVVTRPLLGLTKTRVTPPTGPVNIGGSVTFRIAITNSGSTAITTLPLEDTFSGACFSFLSAVPAPDGVGYGSLFWADLTGGGSLAVGATTNVDVKLQVDGGCDPAENVAAVNYAIDEYGDPVPPVDDLASVTTTAARISGTVYDDPDASGVTNGDEVVLGGVSVGLYTDPNGDGNPSDGTLVAISVTLTNGTYEFLNLATGRYVVVETDPVGYTSTGDTAGANDNRIPVNVTTIGTYPGNDFLDRIPPAFATISGQVRRDGDGDANFADTDAAIADVTIELVQDVNGNGLADIGEPVVQTTSTDAGGNYLFSLVPPGNFVVRETDPSGLVSTADTGGGNDNQIAVTVAGGGASTGNDFLDAPPGSLGDRVWLDEDGDGVQDAGEAGVANIMLVLVDTNGATVASTVTDADGNYRFGGLAPATYTVRVDTNSLPVGLRGNQTFDPDATTNHATTVAVTAGRDVTTADFGYNWAPAPDTDNGSGTGAIGDRLWVDADGDGRQDPGEPGLAGVSVALLADLDADGTYTDVIATTISDSAGGYMFDGVAPGAYVVQVNGGSTPAGYTATGDPDGTLDNRTTQPVVLAPGDVYVNADFGYQPGAGTTGAISGTAWFDADADGIGPAGTPGGGDTTEPVLAGVTVALIRDSNGNGVWDAGEPVVAGTVTDAAGNYAFSGLPVADGVGTDDYLVWVNDTDGALVGTTPTYDNDGTTTANISAVANLSPAGNAAQDFGYTALGQTAGLGLIGDTIFLDRDDDDLPDAGEGIEGVTVRLYTSTGTLAGETVTGPNGYYAFGGLAGGTYTVRVDTATMPGNPGLLANTTDPDGGTANESSLTLNAGQVNLAQDFGYRPAGSLNVIGGTLWDDRDGDGELDAAESNRYAGVTVALLGTNGLVVATTITDADGNYSFTSLPNGTYRVDVTDTANVLDGAWHTTGGTAGADNNSQADPYTVTVTGGESNSTGDFGYFRAGAALGNYVWDDSDGDGIQDGGEAALSNVVVTLTVTYPGGVTSTVAVATDVNGFYAFPTLLDEDYDGVGGGEPTYALAATTPIGYLPTQADQGGDDAVDSDASGVAAAAARGTTDNTYDFAFARPVTIGDFTWNDLDGDGVQDLGEPGLSNVVVTLYRPGGIVSGVVTSDVTGAYAFTALPGSYYLGFTPPADWVGSAQDVGADTTDSDADPVTGETANFTLGAGSSNITLDAGFYLPATIGGRVLVDVDGDGTFDGADTNGIGSVVITLLDASSNVVGVTTTSVAGVYSFTNLPPGSYTVVETDPSGYLSTGDSGGANDNRIPVTITSGQTSSGNDFLDAQPGTISGFVYVDADADGAFDAADTNGIAGVVMTLLDASSNVVGVTTTSLAGAYSFTNVPPGSYTVVEDDPLGYRSTGDVSGANDNRVAVALASGATSAGNNYLDVAITLESYRSNYTSVTNLYYRDPENTGQPEETIYVGGSGYQPNTPYDVAYYDSAGRLVYTDTTAYATNSGFLFSVNPNTNDDVYYGTWTAVVMPDGTTPQATLAAQLVEPTSLITDPFDVITWSTTVFTDIDGVPVSAYGNSNGTGAVYMQTIDRDQNLNTNAIEQVTVTLTNAATGDSESVTLYETGPNTGVFANDSGGNRLPFPISTTAGGSPNDGTLIFVIDDNLQVLYVDPTDPQDKSGAVAQTLALIGRVGARRGPGGTTVEWTTVSEFQTAGFQLERLDGEHWLPVSAGFVSALPPAPAGATYAVVDTAAPAAGPLTYRLVEAELLGGQNVYGPWTLEPTVAAATIQDAVTRRVTDTQGERRAAKRRQTASREQVVAPAAMAIAPLGSAVPEPTRLKIETGASGQYAIPAATIASAGGLPIAAVERAIRDGKYALTCAGTSVPWAGISNHVVFFAAPYADRYTATNVYWLAMGTRKAVTTSKPGTVFATTGQAYTETRRFEQSRYAPVAALVNAGEDFWMWDYLQAGHATQASKRFAFTVDAIASSSKPTTLIVRLAGSTRTAFSPDHHVRVVLNGTELGEARWDGVGSHPLTYTLAPSLLREGTNELQLTALLDAGNPYSVVYLDQIQISYPRRYQATDGRLLCTADGNAAITAEGFRNPNIEIHDVTSALAPVRIDGAAVEPYNGGYRVTFKTRKGANVRYALNEVGARLVPLAVRPRTIRNFASINPGAEYIVVAPDVLRASAQTLADRRAAQGLTTLVAGLEELYDVFSAGRPNPEAIRSLLRQGWTNWSRAPRYALLLGSGTYDYANALGLGENLIPPLMISTPGGVLPSDAILGDVAGDAVPEIAVGRLPVYTSTEFADAYAKLVTYETTIAGVRPALMAADNRDTGGNFPGDSRELGGRLGGTLNYLDLVAGQTAAYRTALFAELRAGRRVMNWAGHGGVPSLAAEGVLTSADVPALNNASAPTMLVALSCLLGQFAIPGVDTLGEVLATDADGAAAVWAPSGLAYHRESMHMGRGFFDHLGAATTTRLGDAVLAAQARYAADGSVPYGHALYNLLGDPALVMTAGSGGGGTPTAVAPVAPGGASPASDLLPEAVIQTVALDGVDAGTVVVRFRLEADTPPAYRVELANDLIASDWTDAGARIIATDERLLSDGAEEILLTIDLTHAGPAAFLRVVLVPAAP